MCGSVLISFSAQADAALESTPTVERFGLGGAYGFGLATGLAIFALRRAIAARKSHLAEFGKR